MSKDWKKQTDTIEPLLDTILEYFPPVKIEEGNTQMLITSLDFSSFVGRIAIGRLQRGEVRPGMPIILAKRDGTQENHRIKDVFVIEGTKGIKFNNFRLVDILA